MMARTPDLSCTWSELTSKPRRESISSWFSTRSAPEPSPAASKAAICAASSADISGGGVSSAICVILLNDHFFEQHVTHLVRRGRDIDPAEQFLFQAQHAGRAFEIVEPEFAQIGLELVGDARHQGLKRRLLL